MNASSESKPATKATQAAADTGLMGWLAKPEPKATAAKGFKVKRLDDLEKEAKEQQEADAAAAVELVKQANPERKTGLEAVLSAVRGSKKEGVLDKTREEWKDLKGQDEELNHELEAYKKDKNRYTDKVAFLERSDVREWEYEQAGKRRRR